MDQAFEEICGPNWQELKSSLEVIRSLHQFECGKLDVDQFLAYWKKWIPGASNHQIIHAWNSLLGPIPLERLDWLSSLKSQYGIGMLSNTNEIHIDFVHQYLAKTYSINDFETRFFHSVHYSHQLGYRKPDQISYQKACELSHFIPEETLFIDDLEQNIQGAQTARLQVYHHLPQNDLITCVTSLLA